MECLGSKFSDAMHKAYVEVRLDTDYPEERVSSMSDS